MKNGRVSTQEYDSEVEADNSKAKHVKFKDISVDKVLEVLELAKEYICDDEKFETAKATLNELKNNEHKKVDIDLLDCLDGSKLIIMPYFSKKVIII